MTKTLTEICSVPLKDGSGQVSVVTDPVGHIYVRRFAERGSVENLIGQYDFIDAAGKGHLREMDSEHARAILDRLTDGEAYSSCFIFYEQKLDADYASETTDMEHKFTSTGIKFWRHEQQMEAYRAGTGDTVISTHISPEGACNLRCPYCSVTFRQTHARIEIDVIKDYVEKLQSRGLKAVILTGGGEPTAYPLINELVKWLKYDRGLSVALITNGTLSNRLDDMAWAAFSWVRVSINMFKDWERRIAIPKEKLSEDCIVGASMVVTVEHEANDDPSRDRINLLRAAGRVADRSGAQYVRVLPNCMLEQIHLIAQHRVLDHVLEELDDPRFFHQHKLHGNPGTDVCHQAYFRPYLSEEAFGGDGPAGTVYPCDSVVLNYGKQHFAEEYQLCRPQDILDFLDRQIAMPFKPKELCQGCVFTKNIQLLENWKLTGANQFDEFPDALMHEEFV